MSNSTYRSRKFILASFFAMTGVAALFFDKVGGGEFVALVTVILGLYAAASVVEKGKLS